MQRGHQGGFAAVGAGEVRHVRHAAPRERNTGLFRQDLSVDHGRYDLQVRQLRLIGKDVGYAEAAQLCQPYRAVARRIVARTESDCVICRHLGSRHCRQTQARFRNRLVEKSARRALAIRSLTLMPPADSPKMVTLAVSPPNAAMFFFTHSSAAI